MQLSLVLGVRSSLTVRPWVGVLLLETMSSQGELWVKAVLSGKCAGGALVCGCFLGSMWLSCDWLSAHYMEDLDLGIVPPRPFVVRLQSPEGYTATSDSV